MFQNNWSQMRQMKVIGAIMPHLVSFSLFFLFILIDSFIFRFPILISSNLQTVTAIVDRSFQNELNGDIAIVRITFHVPFTM